MAVTAATLPAVARAASVSSSRSPNPDVQHHGLVTGRGRDGRRRTASDTAGTADRESYRPTFWL